MNNVTARILLIMFGGVIVFAAGFLLQRNQHRRDPAPEAPFTIMQGNIDGHPLFATINIGLRDSHARQSLPHFLSISTALINPTDEGLPTTADGENLNVWEDAVEASLRSTGVRYAYLGRVTWNGNRELLYYLADPNPPAESLKSLAESHTTRPFAFTSERDDKWTHADFWLNRK